MATFNLKSKISLEQQVDELELLQSMFSAPGEFEIDDQSSYDQISAFLKDLLPEPHGRLSYKLHILTQIGEDGGTNEESGAFQHTVDISFRLPHRLGSHPRKGGS